VFDRIVVALDGSPEAQAAGRLGLQVASSLGSVVTAVSVIDVRVVEGPAVETLAPLWGEVTGRPFQPELLRLYRERADATLDDFCAAAESVGVVVAGRIADIGIAEEAILERTQSADLLVMGRRGEHAGFGRQVVGATLWRVLHHSPCPVLVGASHLDTATATPSRTALPRLPLVAWDCSPGGRAALELALLYATAVETRLCIVHAGDESCDAHLEEAHAAAAEAGVDWESARLNARPAEAVSEAWQRWGTDCLFMGAFGRGRLRDFLFGSHTAEILEKVDGPVFVTS
jgi:nucleotide-binding universal stress UspA family protein